MVSGYQPMSWVRTTVVSLGALLAVTSCKLGASQSPKGEASSGIKQIAVGADFTVALFNDGHVRMIGSPLPGGSVDVQQVGFGGKVVKITAGKRHICALLESGAVRCMGRNAWGALGYDHLDTVSNPERSGDVDMGGKVIELSGGHGYTCGLLEGGQVRCWGSAQGGRLGYGERKDIRVPASAGDVPVGGAVKSVVAGPLGITCAILETGSLRCWGQSLQGGLGYGSTDDVGTTNTPESVGDVELPSTVTQVAVGASHVCALLDGGKVRCWGFGSEGRLGYPVEGNIGDDETPMKALDVDLGGTVTALTAGANQTCARLDSGTVRCWGVGRDGQLGYGDTAVVGEKTSPAQAGDVAVGGVAKQIAASPTHTCALLETGSVMCWGRLSAGVSKTPTPVDFGA